MPTSLIFKLDVKCIADLENAKFLISKINSLKPKFHVLFLMNVIFDSIKQ
jgi:hypothetical protein